MLEYHVSSRENNMRCKIQLATSNLIDREPRTCNRFDSSPYLIRHRKYILNDRCAKFSSLQEMGHDKFLIPLRSIIRCTIVNIYVYICGVYEHNAGKIHGAINISLIQFLDDTLVN